LTRSQTFHPGKLKNFKVEAIAHGKGQVSGTISPRNPAVTLLSTKKTSYRGREKNISTTCGDVHLYGKKDGEGPWVSYSPSGLQEK